MIVAGILVAIGSSAAYLQTAFGWTDPVGSPPTDSGAITAKNSNVGINFDDPQSTLVVNGIADFLGNIIMGVATPSNPDEAVNKGYVDAQLANAGGGSFTLFNVATSTSEVSPAKPARGAGVPSCPTGWGEVLAGYGPHGVVGGGGWGTLTGTGLEFESRDLFTDPVDPGTRDNEHPEVYSATYSICSYSDYEIVPSLIPMALSGITQYGYVKADACRLNQGTAAPSDQYWICNTCRVCAKGITDPVGAYGEVPSDSRVAQ